MNIMNTNPKYKIIFPEKVLDSIFDMTFLSLIGRPRINDHHIALLISKKTLFEFLNKKFYYIQGYVL